MAAPPPSDDPVEPSSDDTTRVEGAARPILLGRYRVEATLGRGGFGDVVRAWDTRIRRPVAIKTLRPALAVQYPGQFSSLRERFEHEAEAASRMGLHAHVVGVHDLAADADGTLHLILEYLPGGTLAQRVAAGSMPVLEALRLTADAARGLDAAHQHGIVHRDIKPANLFLTDKGVAKVGDFGIAQIDELSQRSRLTVRHPGTLLYMSPEQEEKTGYLRPTSDEYSLGATLFELLTGQAYRRLTPARARGLLLEMAPGVAALVERMMAREEERYGNLADVAAVIEGLGPEVRAWETTQVIRPPTPRLKPAPLPDEHEIAPPPAPPAPTPGPKREEHEEEVRPARRPVSRRAVLAGIGGLAVAAGGGAIALWAQRQGPEPPTPTVALTAAPSVQTPTAASVLGQPGTITRTPATASPSLLTWQDPGKRVQLQYPGDWQVLPPSSGSASGTYDFAPTSGAKYTVSLYAAVSRTPHDQVADAMEILQNSYTSVTFGAERDDVRVGGEPAGSAPFMIAPVFGLPERKGGLWITSHKGMEYQFVYTIPTASLTPDRLNQFNAVTASVKFLT